MPKPKIPNQRKASLEHKKRIERYVALVDQLYERLTKEAVRIAERTGHDDTAPFRWSDYPETKSALRKLQSEYVREMGAIIMAGTSAEWKESDLVQDLVAKKVLKAYTGTTKAGDEYARYFETDPDALKAFQQRRVNGMKLSDRVWKLSEQYKTELEDAVSAAIEPGQSAMSLAVDIKKCLNEPDLMFRRFRYKDENGQWRKKWKRKITDADGKTRFIDCDKGSYRNEWTGPGYYKSSARNAQRLARTEINMAYRTAEQRRWEKFDFVVGYEVKTTQNGKHVTDICDDLAGKYPKTFVFKGWHPQCMCYCIPILKTEDEFWLLDDDAKSVNEVTDVPKGFKDWVKDNAGRIKKAEANGTAPYFIADNQETVKGILEGKKRGEEADSESYRGNLFARTLYDIQTALISREFKNIESFDELASKASELLSKAVGNDVAVTIDPDLMTMDIAKAHLTELLSITRDYNLRQGRLSEIRLGYRPQEKSEGGVTTYIPSQNKKIISLSDIIDERDTINAIKNSRCDHDRLQFSLASHEGGHLLFSYNAPQNKETLWIHQSIREVWVEYQKEFNSFMSMEKIEEASKILIGTYGHANPAEFMAECFQEYRNSSYPSKYAKKIGKLLDSYFRK